MSVSTLLYGVVPHTPRAAAISRAIVKNLETLPARFKLFTFTVTFTHHIIPDGNRQCWSEGMCEAGCGRGDVGSGEVAGEGKGRS